MGGRPMMMFAQNGVEVVAGCPELPIREVIESYLSNTLETGENACGGEGHDHGHCHHHGEGHHCHHVNCSLSNIDVLILVEIYDFSVYVLFALPF